MRDVACPRGRGPPPKLRRMAEGRPAIPRALERELFIEAGYRCAIPTCRAVAPLQIDHIEDWAGVQEHRFENMIVLCANCHGLKGEKPRQVNRVALRQYKASLGLLNHRYGELERRLLEDFGRKPSPNVRLIPGGMELFLQALINDGYLYKHPSGLEQGGMFTGVEAEDGETIYVSHMEAYSLTAAGQEFVRDWLEAKPLPI